MVEVLLCNTKTVIVYILFARFGLTFQKKNLLINLFDKKAMCKCVV